MCMRVCVHVHARVCVCMCACVCVCACVHARVQGDGVGEMFDDKYTCMLTLCVLMSASLFIYLF